MPAIASDTGSDFKKLEPGTYAAVCDMVVMLGMQTTPWGNKSQVYLRWEVPSERVEYERDGQKFNRPMSIGATLTVSLNEKATLGQWIQAWRGVPFTADELKGFDLFRVLDKPCMLNVVHQTGQNGKTYANIQSVGKLVKGMEIPKAEMPILRYSPDETQDFDKLPEWLQKKLEAQVDAATGTPNTRSDADFDDSIPF